MSRGSRQKVNGTSRHLSRREGSKGAIWETWRGIRQEGRSWRKVHLWWEVASVTHFMGRNVGGFEGSWRVFVWMLKSNTPCLTVKHTNKNTPQPTKTQKENQYPSSGRKIHRTSVGELAFVLLRHVRREHCPRAAATGCGCSHQSFWHSLFTFVTKTVLIFFPLNNLSMANGETLIPLEGKKKSRQLFRGSMGLTDAWSDWLWAPWWPDIPLLPCTHTPVATDTDVENDWGDGVLKEMESLPSNIWFGSGTLVTVWGSGCVELELGGVGEKSLPSWDAPRCLSRRCSYIARFLSGIQIDRDESVGSCKAVRGLRSRGRQFPSQSLFALTIGRDVFFCGAGLNPWPICKSAGVCQSVSLSAGPEGIFFLLLLPPP